MKHFTPFFLNYCVFFPFNPTQFFFPECPDAKLSGLTFNLLPVRWGGVYLATSITN
jgi:hypothetical protein